jgi:hypothetical protein
LRSRSGRLCPLLNKARPESDAPLNVYSISQPATA